MLAFIIINIIILALFAYFGLSVEASLIIIGVLWGLIIILATKSKQETQEKLGKLKIIKKEKNEKFEPTKII